MFGERLTAKLRLVALALLVASIVSCGYRFSPGGEQIDPNIRTVYVENFANRTVEANLETYMRNSFLDQFRRTTRFRLASDRAAADAVLRGSINALATTHLSYSRGDFATEDRVTAYLDLIFEDRNREIIWSNPSFAGYRDYAIASGDSFRAEANRRDALQRLADDLAERAVRAILSGF